MYVWIIKRAKGVKLTKRRGVIMPRMEDLLLKDFKKMMSERSTIDFGYDYNRIPLPSMTSLEKPIYEYRRCVVNGLDSLDTKSYKDLEGKIVFYIPPNQYANIEEEVCNVKTGQKLDEFVNVPSTHVRILSNVMVLNEEENEYEKVVTTEKSKTVALQGQDCWLDGKVKIGVYLYYSYIIPRKYVRTINYLELLFTFNRRSKHYGGYRLALQTGLYAYLYVMPFTYKQHRDSLSLGVCTSMNIGTDINNLIALWKDNGIIFDLNLTELEDYSKGVTNLAYQVLEPTILDVYTPIGETLEKDNLLLSEDLGDF